jgi:YD repeat-containing protein
MAGLVGGLRGGGGGAGGELPGEYLAGKAPQQVAPGTTVLEGQYVNDLGRVEPWTAHYDEYGRLIGRTDYNAGNLAQGIPDTHYHVYDWSDPGQPGHEILAHVPGVFKP